MRPSLAKSIYCVEGCTGHPHIFHRPWRDRAARRDAGKAAGFRPGNLSISANNLNFSVARAFRLLPLASLLQATRQPLLEFFGTYRKTQGNFVKRAFVAASCLLALSSHAIPQETTPAKPAQDDAAAFGALPFVYDVALSADGKKLVGVAPATGTETLAFVLDLEPGAARKLTPIIHADGQPMRLTHCDWSALDRVVCSSYGIQRVENVLVQLTRLFAIDADGKGQPL